MTRPQNATLEQLHQYCDFLEQRHAAMEAQLVLLQKQHEDSAKMQRLLEQQVQLLREQVLLGRKQRFGSSSERTHPDQVSMVETMAEAFNEAEALADASPEKDEPETQTVGPYKRRKKQNTSMQEKLELMTPDRTIRHELPEDERVCPQCTGALHTMKTERRLDLNIIRPRVEVVEHLRDVYACRSCERNGTSVPVIAAPMPASPLPGSPATAPTIAHIITEKYVKGLPLYRQEQYWQRDGIGLPRQTMANWVVKVAERLFTPLYEAMAKELLTHDVLHMDETHIQVLREPGRAAETKSTMWVRTSGRDGPPITLFTYRTTRAGKHARELLTGFSGYLQCDGYQVYKGLGGVIPVGCWAHARRGFDKVLKAMPDSVLTPRAQEGLDYCNKLFAIERELEAATPEHRKAERDRLSVPVLDKFKKWLQQQGPKVLAKSAFGQAVHYCLNQWEALTVFLQDGRLELSNNRAENAIRPFVIGRKNWLFAKTPRGAEASAVVYSIVETAKANNLKPYNYLTFLLENLPNVDLQDPAALEPLLPWSESVPAACRQSDS